MLVKLWMSLSAARRLAASAAMLIGCLWLASEMTVAQTRSAAPRSKPTRAAPPSYSKNQFEGVFLSDVTQAFNGDMASIRNSKAAASSEGEGGDPIVRAADSSEAAGDASGMAWNKLISATSLEDLVKGAKLRLDKIVTTPAAFAGGGFQEARKEFSLLALLFAIVEDYDGEVRWKSSSGVAREAMVRVAANTKVGSRQVYDEAKKRLLDLGDLLNGSALTGAANTEVEWSNLIDRTPMMQLLDWSQQEFISTYTADEKQFLEHRDELQRYAELISILGRAALLPEMPDADDSDYVQFANDMILQSSRIAEAAKSNNAELARQAAGQLGQSCTNCHDNYR